jgi:hypothetical protein
MARESKRKRDERRFGKAERLADRVVAAHEPKEWAFPYAGSGDLPGQVGLFWPIIERVQRDLRVIPIFLVENACRVYWDSPKDAWKYREDFPNSSPPYPCFFMESTHPGSMVCDNGKTVSSMTWCPDQWGVMFWAEECNGLDFEVYPGSEDMEPTIRPPKEAEMVRLDDARWEMRCVLIGFQDGMPGIVPAQMVFAIGPRGEMLADPTAYIGFVSNPRDAEEAGSMFHSLLKPVLVSLSFLHCKNVVQIEHQPDGVINRERKKVGLKPFVRYHTINIEPMKKVLRTEGRIETEGLKRALHICRGHFSHYSEEKPLFGKYAGTFWVPAHVRGSLDEGLVVSDYNVKGPEGGPG